MNRLSTTGGKSSALPHSTRRLGGIQRPPANSLLPSSSRTSLSSNGGSRFYNTSSFSTAPSAQQAAAAPETAGTSGEDLIFDWGTDVNANEDLARALNRDTEGTKEEIKKVTSSIAAENNIGDQLKKDTVHVNRELDDNLTKARGFRDDAVVSENMRVDFKSLMEQHMIQPLSSISEDAEENEDPNKWNNKKYLQQASLRKEELEGLGGRETKKEIEAQCAQLEEEIGNYNQAIVDEDLEAYLEQKKKETGGYRGELEAEHKNKLELQAKIAESRRNSAMYAQQITDRQQLLDSSKKKYAEELEKKKQELERAQAEVHGLKTKEQWQAELAEAEKERDTVANVIAEAERLLNARNVAHKDREATQSAIQELKVTEKELMDKVAARRESLEATEKTLAVAENEKERVETEKRANDAFEAEEVVQAELEIVTINKQKDEYAILISKASANISSEGTEATKTEQETKSKLSDLQEKAKVFRQRLEQKKSELEELEKNKGEETTALEKEIGDLQELVNKLEKAIETGDGNLDSETTEQERKVEESKAALVETVESRVENERYLQIISVGEKLLTAKDKVIQNIDASWEARKNEIQEGENLQPTKKKPIEELQTELEGFVAQNL